MFDDVIDRGETSLLLQVKSEGWAGEYVDLGEGDSIPNGAIIKAVVIERVKIYVFLSAERGVLSGLLLKGLPFSYRESVLQQLELLSVKSLQHRLMLNVCNWQSSSLALELGLVVRLIQLLIV